MRKLVFIVMVLFVSLTMYSQNEGAEEKKQDEIKTLFGKSESVGGFGAFCFGYTSLDNNNTLIAGGRGGVILGHNLALGLAGRGFVTDLESGLQINENSNYFMSGGYGGLLIEPILLPKNPVHVSFPIIIGAGGVATYHREYDPVYEYWRDSYYQGRAYMVVEPGVELEFNLAKFMRMSFGFTYRYTSDIDLHDIDKSALSTWNTYVVFKFGKF